MFNGWGIKHMVVLYKETGSNTAGADVQTKTGQLFVKAVR